MSIQSRVTTEVARHGSNGLETLARAGYGARGVVYVTVGILAFLAAIGAGGQTTGSKGALSQLLTSPGGKILLGVTALGLAGMTVWRLVQAIKDTEDKGTDPKGLVTRAMYVVSAVVHGGLAVWAVSALFGGGGSSGSGSQSATAKLMSAPFGVFLVAAVGVIILGFAVQQARNAWTARFMERMEGRPERLEKLGRAGYAARAVVYTVIGVFLLQAALSHDPGKAGGLGEALRSLQSQPYGPWLLGAVSLGLIAFGLFSALEARHRRVRT